MNNGKAGMILMSSPYKPDKPKVKSIAQSMFILTTHVCKETFQELISLTNVTIIAAVAANIAPKRSVKSCLSLISCS